MATESCGGSNNELLKALGIAGSLIFISQLMKRLFKYNFWCYTYK